MVFCKTFYTEELVLDFIIIYQMGYAVVSPVIEAVGVTIIPHTMIVTLTAWITGL